MTLSIRGLEATYGSGARAIEGIELDVDDGEVLALLGANGAGKTTTLRAISGMVHRRGSIRLDGTEISGYRSDRIARLGIGHIPQGRGTLKTLSVRDNLLAGAVMRRERKTVANDLASVYRLFPRLEERLTQTAGNLSGGEQQMLAIGRALMAGPRLLLLDEPSLGLAPKITQEMFALIARLREETGVTMLIVEQNARLALDLADHAVILESGVVRASGPAKTIMADGAVQRAYLGGEL